jgi:hypothetical protein
LLPAEVLSPWEATNFTAFKTVERNASLGYFEHTHPVTNTHAHAHLSGDGGSFDQGHPYDGQLPDKVGI